MAITPCRFHCESLHIGDETGWLPYDGETDIALQFDNVVIDGQIMNQTTLLLLPTAFIPCPACNPAAMSYGDDVALPWVAVEVATP